MSVFTVANYKVSAKYPFRVNIAKGNITEFSYPSNPERSSIVNSSATFAGGFDKSIAYTGGAILLADREKLPSIGSALRPQDAQCPEGRSVILGPNKYGLLNIPYVIHASTGYSEKSLLSAYSSMLECAEGAKLEAIALSPPSALFGSYTRIDSTKTILNLIKEYDGYDGLKHIYICSEATRDVDMLVRVGNDCFGCRGNEFFGSRMPTFEAISMGTLPGTSTIAKKTGSLFGQLAKLGQKKPPQLSMDDSSSSDSEQDKSKIDTPAIQPVDTSLTELASYNIHTKHSFRLVLIKGNIVEFSYPFNPQLAAIVNRTDVEGLGGGKVNDAISDAGGPSLHNDRQNLPAKYNKRLMKHLRCAEGKAIITGPNKYGSLKVPFVIHCCAGYSNQALSAAYTSCLACAKKANLEAVAFPILIPGFSLGAEIREAFAVGLNAILAFDGYANLRAIYICLHSGFGASGQLLKIADEVLGKSKVVGSSTDSLAVSTNGKPLVGVSSSFDQRKHENIIHTGISKSNGQQAGSEQSPPNLIVDNKGYGHKDIGFVVEELKESKTIRSLHMNGNRLTMQDAQLTLAIVYSPCLVLLELESNQISVDGCSQIADVLVVNETLQHLHLGRNLIGDDGLDRLAGAICINKSLKSIDLHHNQISNVGAERLADSVRINNTLEYINLTRNQITDDGANNLADALLFNHALKTVDLSYNQIGENSKKRVDGILTGERPISITKRHPNRSSSLFFVKLMSLEEDRFNVDEKLDVLVRCISDVHMMKFFYTAVAMLERSLVLDQEAASSYIRRGLDRTAETCTCEESISCFKIILDKASYDEYIQRIEFHRFDNRAEVSRMENTDFIVNLKEAVKSNTARIEGLEANVEAINHSLNAMKEGLRRQMKIEATVGFLCATLNAISFGVGGSLLDATFNALGSIVDYSDIGPLQLDSQNFVLPPSLIQISNLVILGMGQFWGKP